jgi:TetR/AcrR family transcriptional regulator, fatty acid metabolism regulator protein
MPPRPQRTSRDTSRDPSKPSGKPVAAKKTVARAPKAVPVAVGGEAGEGTDRRKQILKAAVKVFAERGYHGCRISDVAEEAGVAYGLVYHYYGNKDGLLSSIFDTNWAFFGKAVDDIVQSPEPAREKIVHIIDFVFSAYEMAPLVVKVLILEFGRSSRLGEALDHPTVGRVFESMTKLFRDARAAGELHQDIDPASMTMIFVGAMETALASLVLAPRTGGKSDKRGERPSIEAMKNSLVGVVLHGAVVSNRRA